MFSITERTLEPVRTNPPFYSIYLVFDNIFTKTMCPLDRKEKSFSKNCL